MARIISYAGIVSGDGKKTPPPSEPKNQPKEKEKQPPQKLSQRKLKPQKQQQHPQQSQQPQKQQLKPNKQQPKQPQQSQQSQQPQQPQQKQKPQKQQPQQPKQPQPQQHSQQQPQQPQQKQKPQKQQKQHPQNSQQSQQKPQQAQPKLQKQQRPAATESSNFSASSVLAPSYVPYDVRSIHYQPITQIIKAREPPNMMESSSKFYQMSVHVVPTCYCPKPHPINNPWQDGAPVHIIDPYFALRNPLTDNHHLPPPQVERVKGKNEYLDVLQNLLRVEFEEKMRLYERYSQYNINLEVAPKKMVCLTIPGIHNARPPLEQGDKVLLRPLYNNFGYNGVEIHAYVVRTMRGGLDRKTGIWKPDKVWVTWVHRKQLQYCTFAVRFLPSTTDLRRCFSALHWVRTSDGLVTKNILFPTESPKIPYDAAYHQQQQNNATANDDPDLNEKQRKFVNMVLTRTRNPSRGKVRPPMILTGPAGTGKTRTLLTSIIKALDQTSDFTKRILVCTPSHTACDVITRRLAKFLPSKNLFRLYDSARPIEMVPADILPFAKQSETGAFLLPSAKELLSYTVIVCTCTDANILAMSGCTNYRLKIRRRCLRNFVETALERSNMSGDITGDEYPHFTHLFIDEAAQATEPQTLVPLSVVVDGDDDTSIKAEIALAGDPRQLCPDIYSSWASKSLQKSLLERLLQLPPMGGREHLLGPPSEDNWTSLEELIEYSFQRKEDHDNLSVFLSTSYRGHPSFLMIPSKLFYFDKLRSAAAVTDDDAKWCSLLRKVEATSTMTYPDSIKQNSWPIHFRGVLGSDRSVAVGASWGSNSWGNPEEASEVTKIVHCLVSNGVSTSSIGVMAAFRAQVVSIRNCLRQQNLGNVNVGIVEDYQAVEREVIILSLTRSSDELLQNDVDRRVGLFKQERRMNVALTRAEKLLIVVGNPKLMIKDPAWKEWLLFCKDNGLWYGEDQ